jgi:hypothetical protein
MDRKRRFRHDRLQRGICIATCMELMHKVDSESQDELYQEAFDDREAVICVNSFCSMINFK